jgi:hypothetical protein
MRDDGHASPVEFHWTSSLSEVLRRFPTWVPFPAIRAKPRRGA